MQHHRPTDACMWEHFFTQLQNGLGSATKLQLAQKDLPPSASLLVCCSCLLGCLCLSVLLCLLAEFSLVCNLSSPHSNKTSAASHCNCCLTTSCLPKPWSWLETPAGLPKPSNFPSTWLRCMRPWLEVLLSVAVVEQPPEPLIAQPCH